MIEAHPVWDGPHEVLVGPPMRHRVERLEVKSTIPFALIDSFLMNSWPAPYPTSGFTVDLEEREKLEDDCLRVLLPQGCFSHPRGLA